MVGSSNEHLFGFGSIAENAFHNGFSLVFSLSGKQICIPTQRFPGGAGIGLMETPASSSAASNWDANIAGSTSGDERTDTARTLPRKASITSYSSFVSTRGANLVSSATILDCCVLMVVRCAEAIHSSDTNNKTLNTVSKNTPITTNQNADLWTDSGYLGASYTIPIPSSNADATSNCRRYGLREERKLSETK